MSIVSYLFLALVVNGSNPMEDLLELAPCTQSSQLIFRADRNGFGVRDRSGLRLYDVNGTYESQVVTNDAEKRPMFIDKNGKAILKDTGEKAVGRISQRDSVFSRTNPGWKLESRTEFSSPSANLESSLIGVNQGETRIAFMAPSPVVSTIRVWKRDGVKAYKPVSQVVPDLANVGLPTALIGLNDLVFLDDDRVAFLGRVLENFRDAEKYAAWLNKIPSSGYSIEESDELEPDNAFLFVTDTRTGVTKPILRFKYAPQAFHRLPMSGALIPSKDSRIIFIRTTTKVLSIPASRLLRLAGFAT